MQISPTHEGVPVQDPKLHVYVPDSEKPLMQDGLQVAVWDAGSPQLILAALPMLVGCDTQERAANENREICEKCQ